MVLQKLHAVTKYLHDTERVFFLYIAWALQIWQIITKRERTKFDIWLRTEHSTITWSLSPE